MYSVLSIVLAHICDLGPIAVENRAYCIMSTSYVPKSSITALDPLLQVQVYTLELLRTLDLSTLLKEYRIGRQERVISHLTHSANMG